jgi:hypothetical protein
VAVGVTLAVGVADAVGVALGVDVFVGVAEAVGVSVGVAVSVGVGVGASSLYTIINCGREPMAEAGYSADAIAKPSFALPHAPSTS